MLVWQAAEHNADVIRRGVIERDGYFTLDGAASLLNVDVFERTDLPKGTSGMVIKLRGEDRPRAYINANDVPQRRRFTLAHELGHVVERTVEAHDDDFSFHDTRSTSSYDLHEFYADQFAGALLMPRGEVERVSPALDDALAVSVAFDVSVSAATKRLERLRKQAPQPA